MEREDSDDDVGEAMLGGGPSEPIAALGTTDRVTTHTDDRDAVADLDAVATSASRSSEAEAAAPLMDAEPAGISSGLAAGEVAPKTSEQRSLSKERTRKPRRQAASETVRSDDLESGLDLDAIRAAALPAGSGGGTPAGLDPAVLAADTSARAQAEAAVARGDRRAAGDILASRVIPPASLGQARAVEAARHYLAAGSAPAASAITQAGLALGGATTTDRVWLHILLGDALRQLGDETGAAEAYGAAAAAR
jgi:hypothetical protein